jgi:mannose-1-phosphate guanylyltransferase
MQHPTDQHRVAVIMAGGSGERFWPLSRHARPKQLLRLTHDSETMLSEAVTRLAPIIPPQDIYVATAAHLIEPIRQVRVGIPEDNFIAEPCKRNTAGCLALAAVRLLATYGVAPEQLTMAVVTADHVIGDGARFSQSVAAALAAAEQHDALATIGIAPTRPETGYGYIRIEPDAARLEGFEGDLHVYPVGAYVEKPDRARAEEFVRSGRYFWNSGMFAWKISTFLAELVRARPAMYAVVEAMRTAAASGDDAAVHRHFESLENISIDYALMERASKVVVVRGDFPWDDVGAWPALDRTRRRDSCGNVVHGNPVLIDCHDCIVYNEPGADATAVGVVGMRDVIVVVSEDGILVLPKDRAQDVRDVVRELKERQARQV